MNSDNNSAEDQKVSNHQCSHATHAAMRLKSGKKLGPPQQLLEAGVEGTSGAEPRGRSVLPSQAAVVQSGGQPRAQHFEL